LHTLEKNADDRRRKDSQEMNEIWLGFVVADGAIALACIVWLIVREW
jgi:hypothetical protein